LIGHFLGIHGFMLGMIGAAALIGHILPIFFKFEGGKGVATALGAFLALSPIVGIVAIGVWVIMAAVFRYSSLASLIAALAAPITAIIIGKFIFFFPIVIISGILAWRHWDNIQRLRVGTESKISF